MDGIARNVAGTRAPEGGISGMVMGRVLNQVSRLPFRFNIRIQGPFRALVATGRSFSDPSELIRAALPGLLERQTPPDTPVQPQESELCDDRREFTKRAASEPFTDACLCRLVLAAACRASPAASTVDRSRGRSISLNIPSRRCWSCSSATLGADPTTR